MRLWWLMSGVCVGLACAAPARAQCSSNASSCVTCHETQGLRSVLGSAQPWHIDHGFGDLCAACHAGNPTEATQELAHLGRRHPLEDPDLSCAGCHEHDAAKRAESYRNSGPLDASTPPAAPATPVAPDAGAGGTTNRILVGVALLLAVALQLALRRERTSARRPWLELLREKTWNPYAAGALLGIVVAFAQVFSQRPIAVSGAFDKLAAYAGSALFPESQYYRYVMTPGITWQVWLLLGLLGGSFASSKLSSEARLRWLPDSQWLPRFGNSRLLRLCIAFFGAVWVQIGAGIAGGCTSGLAISGGAVLAPAAFLFMTGMFLGGIPTAWLWYRGSNS